MQSCRALAFGGFGASRSLEGNSNMEIDSTTQNLNENNSAQNSCESGLDFSVHSGNKINQFLHSFGEKKSSDNFVCFIEDFLSCSVLLLDACCLPNERESHLAGITRNCFQRTRKKSRETECVHFLSRLLSLMCPHSTL